MRDQRRTGRRVAEDGTAAADGVVGTAELGARQRGGLGLSARRRGHPRGDHRRGPRRGRADRQDRGRSRAGGSPAPVRSAFARHGRSSATIQRRGGRGLRHRCAGPAFSVHWRHQRQERARRSPELTARWPDRRSNLTARVSVRCHHDAGASGSRQRVQRLLVLRAERRGLGARLPPNAHSPQGHAQSRPRAPRGRDDDATRTPRRCGRRGRATHERALVPARPTSRGSGARTPREPRPRRRPVLRRPWRRSTSELRCIRPIGRGDRHPRVGPSRSWTRLPPPVPSCDPPTVRLDADHVGRPVSSGPVVEARGASP